MADETQEVHTLTELKELTRDCKNCGKSFHPVRWLQECCSNNGKCRTQYNHNKIKQITEKKMRIANKLFDVIKEVINYQECEI